MKKLKIKKMTLFLLILVFASTVILAIPMNKGFALNTVKSAAYMSGIASREPVVEINNKRYENAGVKEFYGEYYFSMGLIKDVLKINLAYNLINDQIHIDWQGIMADVSCQKVNELSENPGGFPIIEDGTIYLSESFLRNVLKIDLAYDEKEDLFSMAFLEEKKPINSNEKIACLTFDDGIDPKITNEVLDILKENNIKASFFIIGKTISWNQKTLDRMVAEGHVVGNHSFTHKASFLYESLGNLDTELKKTDDAFVNAIGWKPKYFRPPYGITYIRDKEIKDYLEGRYSVELWNVDSRDSLEKNITPEKILKNIKIGTYGKKRAVIIMHCTKSSKSTVEALPEVISWLRASGYVFKTIAE